MEQNLDIVKMIEKNPNTRLSKKYESILINKILKNFTEDQQKLFVTSFFCYLKYDSKDDFVVEFSNIWKWSGFSRKDPAKRLLEKFFVENIDYKILLHQSVEQDFIDGKKIKKLQKVNKKEEKEHGGHNKEKILLTVKAFKKFCLKANTKKADEIHDYYIKLEELLLETINDETDELRIQLQIKDNQLVNKEKEQELKVKMARHNILIEKQRFRA